LAVSGLDTSLVDILHECVLALFQGVEPHGLSISLSGSLMQTLSATQLGNNKFDLVTLTLILTLTECISMSTARIP